jgi:hypothetical protein
MDLCVYESEEREHGVGACVNAIIMSDVLYGIGLAESASSALPAFDTKGGERKNISFLKNKNSASVSAENRRE